MSKTALWARRSWSVEEVASRVPIFGLPVYDNITGPPEPPEGWEPTEATCARCYRLIPYAKERVTPQGYCYCEKCWDELRVAEAE